MDLERLSARGGWGAATATVGGKVTCQARLFFVLAPAEGADAVAVDASCPAAADARPSLDLPTSPSASSRPGEVTLRWFQVPDLAVDTKADGTPVTAADRAAERLVRERLADHFPDDGVLGEEEPESFGASGRRWIVDPIDGTKAFTRGVPLYSTLLALDDEHGPALGVIVLPGRSAEVVYAGPGPGLLDRGRGPRPGQRHRHGRRRLPTSSSYSHWPDARPAGGQARGRRAAHVGRRLRLRAGGDGPGRRHGRPHGRALRRGRRCR